MYFYWLSKAKLVFPFFHPVRPKAESRALFVAVLVPEEIKNYIVWHQATIFLFLLLPFSRQRRGGNVATSAKSLGKR